MTDLGVGIQPALQHGPESLKGLQDIVWEGSSQVITHSIRLRGWTRAGMHSSCIRLIGSDEGAFEEPHGGVYGRHKNKGCLHFPSYSCLASKAVKCVINSESEFNLL